MEKKNPNIYQRALDIVNNRINPDIPQGGGEYALKEDLGELADLETTDKSNLVAAINEVKQIGGDKPYHVGTNPPANTNLFWIDTSDEVEVSLANGVLTFVGVDPVTDIELVGTELRMR